MTKNNAASVADQTALTTNAHAEELLQDVMTENLDVMLAIVMKIREDPEFASNIYQDCPRLQHLLNQHPDLRPVFEDPKFVRLNFEAVYRKAGGVLPEDKPNTFRKILVRIVTHPLFRVLRFLFFIKRMVSCAFGGGIGLITSLFFADAAANVATSNLEDAVNENPVNVENREALNHAAEYMEDPAVQEKMHALLESNPENLDEAIEQDPELRALRDANPLCAEMMQDPETMRILVDPDNLRALAECPDLVAADFADPDWEPPDVPPTTFDDAAQPPPPEPASVVEGVDLNNDGVIDNHLEDEEMDDEFLLEGLEHEGGDEDGQGSSARRMQRSNTSQSSSFFGTIRDFVAAEMLGSMTEGFSASEGLDASASAVEDQASQMEAMAQLAEADAVGNLEDTMDKMEETHEEMGERDQPSAAATGAAVAAGAVAGGAVGVALTRRKVGGGGEEDQEEEEEEEEEEVEEPKSGRSPFGGMGSFLRTSAIAISAVAKEHLATTLLGDDMGEHVIEKMEERNEDDDDKKKSPDS